jgi:hypothetical protein
MVYKSTVDSYEEEMMMMIHVVFWVVTSCSDKGGYHRFGRPCCIFRVKVEAAWPSETLVSYNITELCSNPEDRDI